MRQAIIRGWWRREDGTYDPEYLTAQVRMDHGDSLLRYPLGGVPTQQWHACLDLFTGDNDSDDQVAEICSSFGPELLVGSGNRYFSETELSKHPSADAWQLRDELLGAKFDIAGSIAFLNSWGAWSYAEYVTLTDLSVFQKSVREALTNAETKWFKSSESSLHLWRHIAEYPYFSLRTNLGHEAVRTTVTVDLLNESQFKVCARRDCSKPFRIQSKHTRIFCSQYCGHLESVRRQRKPKSERE
jgi:hypothetical protein